MQNYTGVHIIFDIFGCDDEQLENQTYIIRVMEDLVNILNTNILVESCHKFSPQGMSLVLIISASHITVHTWPEDQYIGIDIFTCSDIDYDINTIEQYFRKRLICSKIESHKIYRGITG